MLDLEFIERSSSARGWRKSVQYCAGNAAAVGALSHNKCDPFRENYCRDPSDSELLRNQDQTRLDDINPPPWFVLLTQFLFHNGFRASP